MIKNFYKHILNKRDKKKYVYSISTFLGIGFAFLLNVLLVNYSQPEAYGQIKFFTQFLAVSSTASLLGLNYSIARLTAINNEKKLISTTIILGLIHSFLATLSIFIVYLSLKVFGISINDTVVFAAPFIFIYVIHLLINDIFQGTGQIYKLAIFNILIYIILVLGTVLIILLFDNIDFIVYSMVFLGSYTIIVIVKYIKLKVYLRFDMVSAKIVYIEQKNGFRIYLSTLLTTSLSQAIALFFANKVGYAEYGYYALALSLASMFTFLASSFAIASFKDSVKSSTINFSDISKILVITILAYIFVFLVIDQAFFWFYSDEYGPAILYIKILSIAYIFLGLANYFNRFLMGKGLSKSILLIAIYSGIFNLIISIILTIVFGLIGLAVATVIMSIFRLVLYFLSYKRYLIK